MHNMRRPKLPGPIESGNLACVCKSARASTTERQSRTRFQLYVTPRRLGGTAIQMPYSRSSFGVGSVLSSSTNCSDKAKQTGQLLLGCTPTLRGWPAHTGTADQRCWLSPTVALTITSKASLLAVSDCSMSSVFGHTLAVATASSEVGFVRSRCRALLLLESPCACAPPAALPSACAWTLHAGGLLTGPRTPRCTALEFAGTDAS